VVALGALHAIRATRIIRVPEDIALVGFGDIPLADYVVPALTTMRVPAYELGYQAGEMLTHLLLGHDALVESITLNAELVVRQSCGADLQ
jgi:LacI family transcriptional regulator